MRFASLYGLDPYDTLRGTRIPLWVRRHARARQEAAIQIRKRPPIALAPIYGVQPFVMAKTSGCFATAAARSADRAASRDVFASLLESQTVDIEGVWGYEFDVQTRWAFYPAGSPNLISTVFVARGFGTAGVVTESDEHLRQLQLSADFLVRDLLDGSDETPFFCYTLTSDRLVHNANLFGAGLVGMVGALGHDSARVARAVACARTTVPAQRPDGSWPYGDGGGLGWSDNFHTAYNPDGLLQVWLASGHEEVKDSLDRGVEHWVKDFFGPNGEPKYYPEKAYPYDIHSAGTAVDVAARLSSWGYGTVELAALVCYENGSAASVVYCADGDPAAGKELIEVMSGGIMLRIDDSRTLDVIVRGKVKRTKLTSVDKGHKTEMRALVEMARGRCDADLLFAEAVASSLATLAVAESLSTGLPATVESVRLRDDA